MLQRPAINGREKRRWAEARKSKILSRDGHLEGSEKGQMGRLRTDDGEKRETRAMRIWETVIILCSSEVKVYGKCNSQCEGYHLCAVYTSWYLFSQGSNLNFHEF